VSRRAALGALLAAAALAVAGCGGEDAGPRGASFAPAGTDVFVSLVTDFDSEQWEDARAFMALFPDGDRFLAFLEEELLVPGVDLEADVEPALGPELGIAVLDLEEEIVVGFTEAEDPEKLAELLREAGKEIVTREIEGWTVFAEDAQALGAFEDARKDGSLAESDDFEAVTGDLVDEALLRVYASGEGVEAAFGAVAEPPVSLPSTAFALVAEPDTLRLEGVAELEPFERFVSEPYEAELPETVPAGAFLYLSFKDLESPLSALRDVFAELEPDLERDLARVESVLGVSLEEDVLPLFAREGALYARPGFPLPEATLLLQVDDERAARETLDELAGLARTFLGLAEPTTTSVEGAEVVEVPVSEFVSLYYGVFDGKLVLTTSLEGIRDLREGRGTLADDEAFRAALEEAGVPDETVGFAYVDLGEAIPLVLALLGFAGDEVPAVVRDNLEPLESLVAYGDAEDDVLRFSAFLGVE
jgi:hypothetical protein